MPDPEKKAINFTIVPEEDSSIARIYSNFCAIQNSPFDITMTFCDFLPMGEREIQQAQSSQVVKAPVRARIVVPVHIVPGLIAALQENLRLYQESYGPPKGILH